MSKIALRILHPSIKRIENFLRKYAVVGVVGSAGSGKTTLCSLLSPIHFVHFQTDWFFEKNSKERSAWLSVDDREEREKRMNQFGWWDFSEIAFCIKELERDCYVKIEKPYDRTTGDFGKEIGINPHKRTILVDGAILSPRVLDLCDIVLFLYEDEKTCFFRLLEKDKGRREFQDLVARYLLTKSSETVFQQYLLNRFKHKTIVLQNGEIKNDPIVFGKKYKPHFV